MLPLIAQAADTYVNFANLGLDPVAVHVGPLAIRWYSLAYIVGIFAGYWLLRRMLRRPGAPMAVRHLEDLLFYAMVGTIVGGRLAYVLFYMPSMLARPLSIFNLPEGGMAFHGGALGVLLAVLYVARKNGISFLRILDYVACVAPIGLFFGRLANFVNGELWGRATDVPWAIIFPQSGTSDPRHPSQLYEAGLEGLLLFTVLNLLFWKSSARYRPGLLAGVFGIGYASIRFALEFVREPDAQLGTLSWGLTMGQTLSLPFLVGGLYLILTSRRREPVVVVERATGGESSQHPV